MCEDPLFGKLTYKLGDFGSCTFVDKDGKFAGLTERGGVGSKWYMAPETWNEGVFDERSSVYRVGMIAYYLMNELFPPFWIERGEDSLKERLHPHWLQEPLLMRLIPNLWLPFIFRAMEYNPNERLPFLLSLISDINECITKNDPDLIIFDGSKRKSLKELRPASSPLDGFNNDDFAIIMVQPIRVTISKQHVLAAGMIATMHIERMLLILQYLHDKGLMILLHQWRCRLDVLKIVLLNVRQKSNIHLHPNQIPLHSGHFSSVKNKMSIALFLPHLR